MKRLLNDGWEFLKLPVESNYRQACASGDWKKVDLPHDWLIWQKDLYESADAWYRRTIVFDRVPEACAIHFDGVYMDCEILLDGKAVAEHAYGYTAFHAELTGKIHPGANEITVHIRHRSPNSRWYSGSGIFRDVTLMEWPADHIVPDSFYLAEKQEGEGWRAALSAETTGTEPGLFSYRILDAGGKEIAAGETTGTGGKIAASIFLPNAEAWDVDRPVLYTLCYQYKKDFGQLRFGLRSAAFSPDKGFLLNGRRVKLKGVCLHHDLGALGAAFHKKAARRQLLLMKEMGVNALRTSHNPPASAMLDLCDELGILVIDEAFDMWERPKTEFDYARFFKDHEAEDVALWIRRDRCHPSVIMWSVGNEIYDMHADLRGTEVCTMLMNQVRHHDPEQHAAVTFGCNYMPWEGGQRCADVVKVAGYNYGEKLYEEHHRAHPDWVIYGSETASVLSSRGIYHFPIEKSIMSESDLQCSALGNSNTSWGADDLRKMIIDDLKCGFSMGQFIWSGIDYIGEPTPYHTRSCYFGQADTACFPKDPYYLFQSLWTDKPVLHIGVSWDWNPGQMIDVPVMTNFRQAELLLNGRSLGIKRVSRDVPEECLPVWKVPYEAGEIRARAVDSRGNVLCEDIRCTPGDTASFRLTCEDGSLLSDGRDLAFVTVQAADASGHPVDNARDRVSISVTGGGYLAGTDNGDSTDPDGYKQSSRRLFSGKLLLIIASNGLKQDTAVRVCSTAGVSAEIRIPYSEAATVPGTSCTMRIPDEPETCGLIPVRKIELRALGPRELTKENPSCEFEYRKYPANAQGQPIQWQVTNEAGIESPFAVLETEGSRVRVTAKGDGSYCLRALGGNADDHPEIISQIEFSAKGIGNPSLDPYGFISAGLYDLSEGEIGCGNEKGIAFSREGESMAGFSRVDFGRSGSDTLVLPIFALDGKPYEIELYDGIPGSGGKLISVLHYEKPSIWNQYQEETYRLPVRLTGIHCLCFRMKQKVHMKGFSFVRQSRAFSLHYPSEADQVYGDSYRTDGTAVREIGNNVSIVFDDMDFGPAGRCGVMIRGKTDRDIHPITIRIRGENGEEQNEAADFRGNGESEQDFSVSVPGGNCRVSFVFLPGSHFDFEAFRFFRGNSPDKF